MSEKTQIEITKDVALGQLREILVTIGALFFASSDGWQAISGLVVAVVAVAWSLWKHERGEVLFTAARKVFSLTPAALVTFGVISPEVEQLSLALILPLMSSIWSWKANGGKYKHPKSSGPFIILALTVLSLSSCSNMAIDLNSEPDANAIRGSITGVIIEENEGQIGFKADSQTILGWLGKITRITQGEDVKEVLLAPLSGIAEK